MNGDDLRWDVIEMLECPYPSMSKEEWITRLHSALTEEGCDWLYEFNERMNPWPAEAVERLCTKAKGMKAHITELKAELADLKANIARKLATWRVRSESVAQNILDDFEELIADPGKKVEP